MKKYQVQLDEKQRKQLVSLISGGKESARSQTHARILLQADQGDQGPAWTDEQLAEALIVGRATVERVRRRFVEGGLLDALVRRPQPERPKQRKMDGALEAHLVTLACNQTEGGQKRWTMRLLADKLVQLGYVDQISHQTVWVTLKKMNSSPGENSSFAFRRKQMRNLCIGWKTSWRCTSVPTIHDFRRSAWMREANKCWLIPASPSRWKLARLNGWIMSTNAKESAACLLLWNRKREPVR